MEKEGFELDFISIVLRDGSGTKPLRDEQKKYFSTIKWKIKRLSISENTYLAFNTSVCVVKIKKNGNQNLSVKAESRN